MPRRISAFFVAVIICLSIASVSKATIITFSFTGTINTFDSDPLNCLTSGNDFSGTLTFESTTPDSQLGDPTVGEYPQLAPNTLTVDFSGCSLSYQDVIIRVFENQPAPDGYMWEADPVMESGYSVGANLNLSDDEGTVFADDSLPTNPPPLIDFSGPNDFNEFVFQGINDAEESFEFVGQLTELTPEPGSLVLLAAFLGLTLPTRRPRRR